MKKISITFLITLFCFLLIKVSESQAQCVMQITLYKNGQAVNCITPNTEYTLIVSGSCQPVHKLEGSFGILSTNPTTSGSWRIRTGGAYFPIGGNVSAGYWSGSTFISTASKSFSYQICN